MLGIVCLLLLLLLQVAEIQPRHTATPQPSLALGQLKPVSPKEPSLPVQGSV